MLKDTQECSYNNGGYARPLKTWSYFLLIQYRKSCIFETPSPELSEIANSVDNNFFKIFNSKISRTLMERGKTLDIMSQTSSFLLICHYNKESSALIENQGNILNSNLI